MNLDIVYHWAPKNLKKTILQEGIKVHARNETYENEISGNTETWSAPYICSSLNPYKALCYVSGEFGEREIEDASLFQVNLSNNDSVKLRTDGTREIIEVRIFNSIPPDRIRWIGDREVDHQ